MPGRNGSRLEQEKPSTSRRYAHLNPHGRTNIDSILNAVIPKLPSRIIIDKYVEMYYSSPHILVFPVISKLLFIRTLDLAYGSEWDFSLDSAKSCIYTFLSVVTQFGYDDDIHGTMDCGAYASAAWRFVAQITEEMTLDGLQSLIILVHCLLLYGEKQNWQE